MSTVIIVAVVVLLCVLMLVPEARKILAVVALFAGIIGFAIGQATAAPDQPVTPPAVAEPQP